MSVTFNRYGTSDRYVQCVFGNSEVRFDTVYGGAPLIWQFPFPGTSTATDIVRVQHPSGDPYPGAGYQVVVEEGQDLTQASANGETYRNIARTDVPGVISGDTGLELHRRNYYCRENTAGWPTVRTGTLKYIITGFFPDFWASQGTNVHGQLDDAVPPNSNNNPSYGYDSTNTYAHGAGWVTGWTSPVSRGTSFYGTTNTWASPVYFSPYTDTNLPTPAFVYSGILMEANETIATSANWNDRLRSIPYGRVAFRINVGLGFASDDSYAGVLFRKKVPSGSGKNMDHAFNAQGYMLLVYRTGVVSLIYTNSSGTPTTVNTWTLTSTMLTQLRDTANGGYGIKLEIRTFNGSPNLIQLWIDGTPMDGVDGAGVPISYTIPSQYVFADVDAQHLGLIAYTTNAQQRVSNQTNYVAFRDREVFNVGTETSVTFEPNGATPNNAGHSSFTTTVAVGPAGGAVTEKRILYSATQVLFGDIGAPGTGLDTARTEDPLGTVYQSVSYSPDLVGDIVGGNGNIPIIDLIYVGSSGLGFGACCVPQSVTISGGSAPHTDFLATPEYRYPPSGSPVEPHLAINGLPNITTPFVLGRQYPDGSGGSLVRYTGPWSMDSITWVAKWYPYKA